MIIRATVGLSPANSIRLLSISPLGKMVLFGLNMLRGVMCRPTVDVSKCQRERTHGRWSLLQYIFNIPRVQYESCTSFAALVAFVLVTAFTVVTVVYTERKLGVQVEYIKREPA